MKVTFIGIGDMGTQMVPHLIDANFTVKIWDKSVSRLENPLLSGATVAHSLEDAVKGAEVIITSVMSDDVLNLHLGTDDEPGIVNFLDKNSTLIVTSTLNPDKIFAIRDAMPQDTFLLDVPMIGGVKYAREANLVLLAAGNQKVFERALPILNSFGVVKYVGEQGNGAKLKLITNDAIMAAEAGIRETLDLADAYDIDYSLVLDLLQMGPLKPVVVRALDENNPRPLQSSVADVDELLRATNKLIHLPLAESARDRLRQGVDDAGGSAKFIDITNKVTALPKYRNEKNL